MMLDDNHGVARIDELVQDIQESLHVREMEANGRFFQQVKMMQADQSRRVLSRFCVFISSERESSATSLMRCASPPESVGLR